MSKPVVPPSDARREDSHTPSRLRDLGKWDDGALLTEYITTQDQEAFGQIATRYGAMVFRACLRQLGNAHDAEDATQAVFLLLARHPGRAQGSLAGWLHKVARDTAITLLRSRARRA